MKPLAGIRVADFTVHNAGPFCTHLLSQLGAEVIKVESAMRPDMFRKPHPVYGRMGPATFDQVASTKLSIRINLKKPEGVALSKRLVAVSQLAAESFRPGVMGRLGLGYEALRAVKPDLVMLSVSSSGQSGPDAHFGGYAPLFGAWGGLGEMTGYADGPPVEMRHVMDHTVGMNAAVAALAALHHRSSTGEGSYVDVSARDVASSLLGEALLLAAAGEEPHRSGNAHPRMAPHGVYPAAGEDRWLAVAVGGDDEWQPLAALIGCDDPRFASEAGRRAHADELDAIVACWTGERDANAVAEALQVAGIAAHASWTTPEIAADPHLRARGAIVTVEESDGKERAAVGVPMRLSKGPEIGIHRGTPALGEDEDYVYGELLGMARGERQALEDAEVIFEHARLAMNDTKTIIGFIGLGVMGGGMCRNVVTKHPGPVHAFDMNPSALAEMVAAGAIDAGSIVEVAKAAEVIFLSLPGGKQVAAVCEEVAAHARSGATIVDLSTTGVAEARAVAAALAARGIAFADAPVARTRQAALEGTLSIMVGASEALFAQVQPLLRYMGSDVTHCGEVGCGQVVKLINNTLLFEHVAALAEMMVVAERAGVAPAKLIEAVSLGSGDSFALRNHGLKAMAPRVFPERSFPSPYVLKDIGYAIELAESYGVEPRMAERAREYYARAVEAGIGAKYFPAIIELVDGGRGATD